MHDIQNHLDDRALAIDKVGVCSLRYPIVVLDRNHESQATTAAISMSVSLPHQFKGTHMSRFIEVLNEHRGEVTMRTLPRILEELKTKLQAESAHIEVSFPYFLERCAPVSGAAALIDYQCQFTAEANCANSAFLLSVCVPVTSLCPCSKAISDYGAHNQRGEVAIHVKPRPTPGGGSEMIWIEELIEVAESSASAPVYALLKRPDERHVTMQAYDNPVFVEDIVRSAALRLQADDRVAWFRVRAVNHESIHDHDAFAEISWERPLTGRAGSEA
jgi:GTP cyclohydrolase I